MNVGLTGIKFGLLTVVGRKDSKSGHVRLSCKCDCGNDSIVMASNLRSGHTKSCGCLQVKLTSESKTKHGKRKFKIYSIWQNMLNRCRNKNTRSYKDYGERGISVCDRWQEFDNFYADMGDPPKGKTLDRYPNNNGNYEPTNCRWASTIEQQNNTRKNRLITFDGRIQTMAAWAREVGLDSMRIQKRLNDGWSTERALMTPIRKMKRKTEWQTRPQI